MLHVMWFTTQSLPLVITISSDITLSGWQYLLLRYDGGEAKQTFLKGKQDEVVHPTPVRVGIC